jgi:hypothetical protein
MTAYTWLRMAAPRRVRHMLCLVSTTDMGPHIRRAMRCEVFDLLCSDQLRNEQIFIDRVLPVLSELQPRAAPPE